MGKIRGKIIDRNRYSKRYPFVRAPKRYTYLGDDELSIELGTITFSNETVKQFNFEASFNDTDYAVMAMPRDSAAAADGSAQVSLMVDGSTVDRSFVRIIASAPFTGQVDVIAIKVGT
tara:strand:- start:477 stop:830 length:354 start_codon:yes stop_codon:yes gene_type:complete